MILIQIKIFLKRHLSAYSMQVRSNSNCQLLCRCVWSSIGKEMCCVCGWREYADEGDLRCPAPYRATTAVAGPSNLVRSQGGRSHEAHWHSGRHIFGFGILILVWTTREIVRRTHTKDHNNLELFIWKKDMAWLGLEERCLFLCFQWFYHFSIWNFWNKERYNS